MELRGPSGDGRAGEHWLVWRKGVVGDEGNCVANMVTVVRFGSVGSAVRMWKRVVVSLSRGI